MSRHSLLVAALAIALGPDVAPGQEMKAAGSPASVTTQPLGATGWRSEAATISAPALGMTGWRIEPVAIALSPLGMTGWRSDPIRLSVAPLGMTGWRREPVRLTAATLGMTGWRSQPDKPPPAIVCLGGQVTKLAAGQGGPGFACACPPGRTAQAAGSGYKNTFQCIPATVVPPPRTVQPEPKRVGPKPQFVCAGGIVRNNACTCQPGFAPVKMGATSFRCERVAIQPPQLPKPATPMRVTAPQPQIACGGGVVRSNVCVCPGGTALQNGVCRAVPRAPVRIAPPAGGGAPQRVR